MSRTLRWLVVLSALCVALGLSAAAWHFLAKPVYLSVAVGPAGGDDAAFVAGFSRTLAASSAAVRLGAVVTSGPVQALDKLSRGEAQLAVIRSDAAPSERVRAVAILHSDPVVIVTPVKNKVEDFGDLKGKALGVIGPPGANEPLLALLRRHYGVSGTTKELSPAPAEIAAALRSRSVEGLLFVVPTVQGATVAASWAAVRHASRRELSFVAIDDAEAIAAAAPAYEAGEIAAGQFGGAPTLPEESVATILVATYLVADRNVSNDAITTLTRSLFEERRRIAADAPIAALVKAASTDKDAVIPVHPGAKVYYDGEETTLMERYGDWLFYGPMLLGALGSALVAVMRFLGLRQPEGGPPLLAKVQQVMAAVEAANTVAELDAVRSAVDNAVARLASEAAEGSIDAERTAATALAISHIDGLIRDRRRELLLSANARA